MIEQLPPDCAYVRAVNGHAWTGTNYQLANLQDVMNVAVTAARTPLDKRMKLPKPVPRPEQQRDRSGDPEQADIVAYLDSLRPPKEE